MAEPRAGSVLPPALIAGGLAGYLGLHLLEPSLPITWSYAHLGRSPMLRPLAIALVIALPLVVMRLRRTAGWDAPLRTFSPAALVGMVLALGVVVWGLGLVGSSLPLPEGRRFVEAQDFYADKRFFVATVNDDTFRIPRWHLTLWALHGIVGTFVHVPMPQDVPAPVAVVIYHVNEALGVVALTALALAARALAATRGEAVAIWLLAATTFGTLELAAGYVDVYPTVIALLALYLWTALRAARGELHPVWPLTIAALGPFWYEGLLLIGPSAALLVVLVACRPRGLRVLAVSLGVAFAAAGAATLPDYGAAFAWRVFASDVMAHNAVEFGYSPTSNLVPWHYLATALHAREVLHTLLLVDGVGMLLVLVLAPALVRRCWREREMVLLAALVAPYLAYAVWMDPVYGAFADWDLFSYGGVATSLLGAALLVRWGRQGSPAFAPLLGLCLAANVVHLLARFHALDVDLVRHLLESPRHVPG
jgi:hypothetical protein